LLALVSSLLLVLFMMAEAAKPKNWQWMWHLAGGAATTDAETAPVPADEIIDTRLRTPERTSHPPGVFVAVANTSTEIDGPTDNAPERDDTAGSAATRDGDVPDSGVLPGVTVEQLQTIRDDTVFRRAETEAWFSWCGLLLNTARTSAEQIPSAPPRVTFLQLFRQPDVYRGRLVRVAGLVRRAHQVSAQPNDQGITQFYQCWLFPDEVGGNPIVIYALKLPDGFPTGMELHEDVEFTGLFFKRWAYQAKGGIMTAPLVLAADGVWSPRPLPTPVGLPSLPWIMAAFGLAAAFGGGVSWLVYQQSNAHSMLALGKRPRDLPDKVPVIVSDASTKD
jgi:hypothetical protein